MPDISWVGVIAATIGSFAVGAVWYSPLFFGVRPGLQFGAAAGFHVGVFFVAGAFGINYLFERRSFKLWLINGGYNIVAFTVLGAILGVL